MINVVNGVPSVEQGFFSAMFSVLFEGKQQSVGKITAVAVKPATLPRVLYVSCMPYPEL